MKNFSLQQIKRKISNHLAENIFLRRVRNFFKNKVFPICIKASLALIALLIVVTVSLKMFKPDYLEKIYQKSFLYFFHYLQLDNDSFSEVKISGNNRAKTEEIEDVVHQVAKNFRKDVLKSDNQQAYEPLIKKMVVEIKKQLPWINKIVITRSMPNTINIFVTEYEPFAIWQDGDKKYVTDKDGNIVLVNDIEEFKHLVILSGKGANTHAKSLFNIFAIDPVLSNRVYSATWLGGRRWDIRFDNGLLIKLPEDNISDAWHSLIKIYEMPGSILGLQVIDLRVEGKIYLEYGDSVIKELKSL